MEENYKFVKFDEYCKTCVYKNDEESDPYLKCNDCLNEPARINSQKPLNYKKAE